PSRLFLHDAVPIYSRRELWISTAMMVVAPVAAAAMIAAVPTAPVPNTATVSPAATPREFKMAPAPVDRPQPKGPRNSKGISSATLTTLRTDALVILAKVD